MTLNIPIGVYYYLEPHSAIIFFVIESVISCQAKSFMAYNVQTTYQTFVSKNETLEWDKIVFPNFE